MFQLRRFPEIIDALGLFQFKLRLLKFLLQLADGLNRLAFAF